MPILNGPGKVVTFLALGLGLGPRTLIRDLFYHGRDEPFLQGLNPGRS